MKEKVNIYFDETNVSDPDRKMSISGVVFDIPEYDKEKFESECKKISDKFKCTKKDLHASTMRNRLKNDIISEFIHTADKFNYFIITLKSNKKNSYYIDKLDDLYYNMLIQIISDFLMENNGKYRKFNFYLPEKTSVNLNNLKNYIRQEFNKLMKDKKIDNNNFELYYLPSTENYFMIFADFINNIFSDINKNNKLYLLIKNKIKYNSSFNRNKLKKVNKKISKIIKYRTKEIIKEKTDQKIPETLLKNCAYGNLLIKIFVDKVKGRNTDKFIEKIKIQLKKEKDIKYILIDICNSIEELIRNKHNYYDSIDILNFIINDLFPIIDIIETDNLDIKLNKLKIYDLLIQVYNHRGNFEKADIVFNKSQLLNNSIPVNSDSVDIKASLYNHYSISLANIFEFFKANQILEEEEDKINNLNYKSRVLGTYYGSKAQNYFFSARLTDDKNVVKNLIEYGYFNFEMALEQFDKENDIISTKVRYLYAKLEEFILNLKSRTETQDSIEKILLEITNIKGILENINYICENYNDNFRFLLAFLLKTVTVFDLKIDSALLKKFYSSVKNKNYHPYQLIFRYLAYLDKNNFNEYLDQAVFICEKDKKDYTLKLISLILYLDELIFINEKNKSLNLTDKIKNLKQIFNDLNLPVYSVFEIYKVYFKNFVNNLNALFKLNCLTEDLKEKLKKDKFILPYNYC